MRGNGFTKGFLIGGVIGAAVSMVMEPDMLKSKSRRRMAKNGRQLLRKSGHVISDVIDLIR